MKKFSKAKVNYKKSERKIINKANRIEGHKQEKFLDLANSEVDIR